MTNMMLFRFLSVLLNLSAIQCFYTPGSNNIRTSSSQHFLEREDSIKSTSSSVLESSSNMKGIKKSHQAIVVGGGPVGLATALMLANAPHFYDVIVYESMRKEDFFTFDPAKAYLYLINGRGQIFTKKYPSLHEKLITSSVPSTTAFVRVPSSIDQAIPEPVAFTINPKKKKKPSKTNNPGENGNEKAEEPSYWIPRHMFTNLMYETVQEHEKERKNSKEPRGSITCYFGRKCVDVLPFSEGKNNNPQLITVCTKDTETETEFKANAKFVVAGDGMNSQVRESLRVGEKNSFASIDTDYRAKKFNVKRYRNPATDLRLKALLIPPKFKISNADGTLYETNGPTSYVIGGKNKGPQNFLTIGMLPVKDNNSVRPGNIITRPDHEVWKISNGEELRLWFKENFPRMNFEKEVDGGIISDEEWNRCAKAEGIRFPYDQYSPALQISSSTSSEINDAEGAENTDCGIVLVGDAAHAFPPSIGQGINAGLADVVQLDKDLRGSSGSKQKPSLGQALRQYEKKRVPETKSLIRLARFGSPYQYNQPHYIDRVRKALWTGNIMFRLLLNKLSFNLIPPPMLMMVMNKGLTYRQMARRADITTAAIVISLISLIIKIFMKRI